MSNNRLLDFALTFAAKIDPSYTKAFKATTSSFEKLQSKLNELEESKKKFDQFFAQQQAVKRAEQGFSQAKAQLASLSAQMNASKQPSEALISEYNKQKIAVNNASISLEKEREQLAKLSQDSSIAGKSLDELSNRQKELELSTKEAHRQLVLSQKIEDAQSKKTSYGSQFAIGVGQAMMLKSLASKFTAPIKLGMEFDKTMSRVGAVSNASAEDLEKLRLGARNLGKSTVFSASQAAEGMTYLAMAGFKTDDMLKAMPGMLNLAAAGQVDLANASDIAASMLNGFGLEASQINRVADTMVNTFANSSTDLQGLGETMKYVAPVAKSMGVDLETVAAMAGKLGDNAIRGSQAGTAMRAVFTRLVAPATEGQKALYALGVSVKDAEGNVRAMPDVLKDIGTALQKLPQAAQAAIKKDIFGQEAMSAAGILMENAVDGTLQNFIDKVKEAGSAERVAKKQTDNLAGDLSVLNSAFEENQLIISDVLTSSLRPFVQILTIAITKVGAFMDKHQTLFKYISYGIGTVGALIASFAAFNMVVGAGGYILMSAVTGYYRLWQVIIFVSGGISKLSLLTKQYALILLNTSKTLISKFVVAIKATALALGNLAKSILFLAKTAITTLITGLRVLFTFMMTNPIGILITAIGALIAIGVVLYKNWDVIKEKASALWSWFSEKCPWLANVFTSAFNGIVETVSSVWNRIKYHFTQIIDFVKNIFSGEWSAAWENVKNIFANVFGGLVGLAKAPINAIISLINKAFSAIGSVSVSIPDWVPGMGGQTFGFEMPQIPMLANGGVVTKPTTALIGEGAESEAVLPLSKLESLLADHSSSAGSSNITINFNPTINVTTDGNSGDAYDQIRKALAEGSSNFQKQIEQYFAQRSRLSYE